MRCKDVKRVLDDFSLKRLPKSKANEIKKHLQGCGKCSRMLKEMNLANSFLEHYKALEPQDALINKTMNRIIEEYNLGGSKESKTTLTTVFLTHRFKLIATASILSALLIVVASGIYLNFSPNVGYLARHEIDSDLPGEPITPATETSFDQVSVSELDLDPRLIEKLEKQRRSGELRSFEVPLIAQSINFISDHQGTNRAQEFSPLVQSICFGEGCDTTNRIQTVVTL